MYVGSEDSGKGILVTTVDFPAELRCRMCGRGVKKGLDSWSWESEGTCWTGVWAGPTRGVFTGVVFLDERERFLIGTEMPERHACLALREEGEENDDRFAEVHHCPVIG